jgi:membrane carboxypeptidase/penicillin-binding protein
MIGLITAAILSIAMAGGVIYAVDRYSEITDDLPAPEQMEVLFNPQDGSMLTPTMIMDQQGLQELWRFENPAVDYRNYVSITDGKMLFFRDVPEEFIQATLAGTDPDYLDKPEGFITNILTNDPDPITQTLVEEFLLWDEVEHPYYEIRVNLLSDQIIANYGRKKVLEWYLNSAYYGREIYGASQASLYYFGKTLEDLDLTESALLVAVANYPSLNPFDAPTAAKENQEDILDKMAAANFITTRAAEQTANKQLFYADPDQGQSQKRPVYVDYILEEASRSVPLERLLRGGYQIFSTIDLDLQRTLDCTSQIMTSRVYGDDPQVGDDCGAARLLPRYAGQSLQAADSLEINLVLLDPDSGELRAMSGISTSGDKVDISVPRDPGSLITPYLYLNQFTQGFEPASLVWDIPLDEELSTETLHPGCGLDCDYQGPVSIRRALVNDYLSPAHKLWAVQAKNTLPGTLSVFGFTLGGETCLDCPVFPDNPYLDLVDLAQGYGVFGNEGFLRGKPSASSSLEIQPSSIKQIDTISGETISIEDDFIEKKIISEELAFLITHTLSDGDVRSDAVLRDVFQIGRPAAVKVGNVADENSAWVIGYTPQILTAAWAGNPDGDGNEADYHQIAAYLWRSITQYITRDLPAEDWSIPANIITLDVCYPSGLLPTENCPRIVREVFIQGNEPAGVDNLYQSFEINRETGLLASVFTPSGQIEDRVYLRVPPDARSWADQAGIKTAPALYDLEIPEDRLDGLSITTPDNYSFVSGRVRVIGSIPEDNFVSARLQYGKGLNPGSWIQIGSDILSPSFFQRLGIWDTRSLEDGIYALQLVLIQERQEIKKTALVVSVDNTPPRMIFTTDLSGGQLAFQPGEEILFEVVFENNSEIDQVEFLLNGELLSVRRVEPYLVPWMLVPGEYELQITAQDQAGNTADYSVEFEVLSEN